MYSENTLRRRAYKIGYMVKKGFSHFQGRVEYDSEGNKQTGYMVMHLGIGFYAGDCLTGFSDYQWTLEDVEEFLKQEYESMGLDW